MILTTYFGIQSKLLNGNINIYSSYWRCPLKYKKVYSDMLLFFLQVEKKKREVK